MVHHALVTMLSSCRRFAAELSPQVLADASSNTSGSFGGLAAAVSCSSCILQADYSQYAGRLCKRLQAPLNLFDTEA